MKKKVIILILAVLLCGCGTKDKYKDYKHYDLRKYDHQTYSYLRNPDGAWYDLEKEIYAVSQLSTREELETGTLGYMEGIFYQVGENDYILLDSFYGDINSYNPEYTLLYKDKIYIVRGHPMYEYTLNRENTTKKELKFNYDAILKQYEDGEHSNYMGGFQIDKVDDDYIYFKNISIHNRDKTNMNIKCSLKDYKCEEVK